MSKVVICKQTFQRGFYKFEEGENYEYQEGGPFCDMHGLGDYEVYTKQGRVSVFTEEDFNQYFDKGEL